MLDSIQELESKLDFDNNNTLDFKALLDSIPTPPKQGWDTKKLQEIANISRGASPRPINEFLTQDSNGINWIKIGDVADNAKYITQTKEKITPQGAEKSKFVKVGDFILSNSMSIGRPYILKIDGCIHDGWLLLSNIDRTISKEFLYYALISSDTQKQFKEKASGMVVENLKIDLVKSVKIPLPPLAAQENIIQTIEKLEMRIENFELLMENLESKKAEILTSFLESGI
ncbi:restriction endonuclease subunit S [Campylobacter helveticus]|uniref:restriction endonuclease subunit S n=1 Tax=Campylobacter helveticus TaxID=28898 RepID=UPI0009D90E30|nr:Type I restriction modification DNA specificity domain-containing protein [Campylobacter helveticus]SUW82644.1 Type I restriction-modification system, specificity subunit S [Campylobacter helveticus]